MIGALTLYQTSIGKKAVMAITGVVLYIYVLLHLIGNLKIYTGAVHLNEYAVFLREIGMPLFPYEVLLWFVRIVLLGSVILHMVAAYQLTRLDLASRPVRYAQRKNVTSSYASRTMRWGGVIIALFVIYHLLHLTFGTVHPDFAGPHDVYHNVVVGFRQPLVSAFYIAAMVALGLHLYHGMWSFAQSLGWRTRENDAIWRGFAIVSAVGIAGGNISFPLAVLLGFIH